MIDAQIMQDETKNKNLFLIKKFQTPKSFDEGLKYNYMHVMCDSAYLKEAMIRQFGNEADEWINAAKKALSNDKDGRFEVDDFIVYVMPQSMVKLHTCQYPFVVIKNKQIIDVDEYWYTPFRNVLQESYKCSVLLDINDEGSILANSHLGYADYGLILKCTSLTNDEDLFVTKSINASFSFF